jgi:hypothetical protein
MTSRFWLGLIVGLLIGMFATAAYYEFSDTADEIEFGDDA